MITICFVLKKIFTSFLKRPFIKTKNMTVGYARVSTPEQNISNQVEVLKENGCEKVFTDILSKFLELFRNLKEI